MSRGAKALLGVFGVLAALRVASGTAPRFDLGAQRVVVLQSDDWGLEGWFPDTAAADSLRDAVAGLSQRLSVYATSSLESAADVDSIVELLSSLRDADGLPPVLQANTVVAGVAAGDPDCALHESGDRASVYARPGLREAVDAAIAAGVWWPELHGLTHFQLEAYARALRAGDPLARRAARLGTVAYRSWRTDAELAPATPGHAARIAAQAVDRFRQRFARAPASVIAPDYVWGDDDERAWRGLGLRVVQAKEEQVDPLHPPVTWWGRVRKVLDRWWDQRRGGLTYLRRPAQLEPYGNVDPACAQGCDAAWEEVRAAWRAGQPAIVGIHRVQLSNLDPATAAAGRAQLRCLLARLVRRGRARFLVDMEVAQLQATGRSRLARGPYTVCRELRGGRLGTAVSGPQPSPAQP